MKIAITGPLADRNLGDYGMFVNNIYDLGVNHKYTVFSYDSSFVNSLKKDFLSEFDIAFKDVEITPKLRVIKSPLQRVKSLIKTIRKTEEISYPTPLELTNRCKNYNEIYASIKEVDVLIVSGGGYFNDLWYEWHRSDDLFKIIIPIIIATQLKKKIMFTANGYGPFDRTKQFYSMIFNEAQRVGAKFASRDNKLSPLYLSELSITKYIEIPDDLYIINERLINKKVSEKYNGYIVLELYGLNQDLIDNIGILNELIEKFYRQGLKTIFMPFDVDSKTLDFLIQNIISKGFEEFEYDNYLKLNDAISMLENAEFVICNRYHAMVLSITSKTPVFNIMKRVGDYRYYYNKNAGLLDKAFGSENINYNDFIATGIKDLEPLIDNGIDNIIAKQKRLYESDEYKLNKKALAGQRNDYFNSIINMDNLI
jgi:polysaccharide pyruvyl transferase WcaK-like protein